MQNILKSLSGNNYINSKKKLFGHRELFGLMLVLVRMKLVSLDFNLKNTNLTGQEVKNLRNLPSLLFNTVRLIVV